MLVDGAHGHVFITGAAVDSQIVVLNEDGSSAGAITREQGAGGMTLSGTLLYVARCGQGAVDVIDTTTLTRVDTFAAAPTGECDLALAAGRLWYTAASLTSVSLDAAHTVIESGRSAGLLAAMPGEPNRLIVTTPGQFAVELFDGTDPNAVSAVGGGEDPGSGVTDLAVSGPIVYIAGGAAPRQVAEFAGDLFGNAGVLSPGPEPNALAVNPARSQLAVGLARDSGARVDVFAGNGNKRLATLAFGQGPDHLYPRGLAYGHDGSHLFAISTGNGSEVMFNILPGAVGTVTLARSRSVIKQGAAVTLTAHLASASANRTVAIYVSVPPGSPATLVASGTVDAAGDLHVRVRPPENASYSAVWNGDDSFAPPDPAPTAPVGVRLALHASAKSAYAVVGHYHLYHYEGACRQSGRGCPEFAVSSSRRASRRAYFVTVQARSANGGWRTVRTASGHLRSNGSDLWPFTYTNSMFLGRYARMRFASRDDERFVGGHSVWVYFRVTR
jgi:hypothetical protein